MSNHETTILDLSKKTTRVLARFDNDKNADWNMAEYLQRTYHPDLEVGEVRQKYQLKSEPMPNGLDSSCWCEGKKIAAIKRLKK